MRTTGRRLLLAIVALIALAPGWLYPWYFDRYSPAITLPVFPDSELAASAHFFDGYLLERDGYLDRALTEYRQALATNDPALRKLAQSASDRITGQLVDPGGAWRITASALELSRAIRWPGLVLVLLIAGIMTLPRLIPRHGLGVAPFPVDAAVDTAAAVELFRSALLRDLETIREMLSSDSAQEIGIVLPDLAVASASPDAPALSTTLDAFKGTSPTQVVQFSVGAVWPFLAGLTDPKRYELNGRVTLTRTVASVAAEMRDLKTGVRMGPWSVSSRDWPLVAGASGKITILKPLAFKPAVASQPVAVGGWFHDPREDSERLAQAASVLAFQIWFDILRNDARFEYRPHSIGSLATTVRAVSVLR
jgi:hypothetical protein